MVSYQGFCSFKEKRKASVLYRGFQGKDVALVEGEDGFEIPMLIKECVVIQTDDYNSPLKSAKKPEAPQAADHSRV